MPEPPNDGQNTGHSTGAVGHHVGDGASLMDHLSLVCELMELAYELLQLLFHPRKLIQKPPPVQLLFGESFLVFLNQDSFQFVQIFVYFICVFPVMMKVKGLERQFACL